MGAVTGFPFVSQVIAFVRIPFLDTLAGDVGLDRIRTKTAGP